jgi:hypothetical protein
MNAKYVTQVLDWLSAHSHDSEPSLRITQEPFSPLVIELESDVLHVGYWLTENGDSVPDPAVRIDISSMHGTVLTQFGNFIDDAFAEGILKEVMSRLAKAKDEQISSNVVFQ